MRVPASVRATLLLVLVFVAGLSAGIMYERQQNRAHGGVPSDTHSLLHRLGAELELTAAQRQTIDQILARHQQDVESTWHEMQPRVHATLDAAEQEIVTVLTPEQARKFRELIGMHHQPGRHQ